MDRPAASPARASGLACVARLMAQLGAAALGLSDVATKVLDREAVWLQGGICTWRPSHLVASA